MKEYDLAAKNFYASQSLKSLPLGSLDFTLNAYNQLCQSLEEIQALKSLASLQKWEDPCFFEKEILGQNPVIIVTDIDLNIVHASNNIYGMNGYAPKEVLGRKPKMFQGEETCRETAQKIRTAILNEESFEATILNYRKDGTPYHCWIKGRPVLNQTGRVVNFMAFEYEVAA